MLFHEAKPPSLTLVHTSYMWPFLLIFPSHLHFGNRLQSWLVGYWQKSYLTDYLCLCGYPCLSQAACETICLFFPNHTQRNNHNTQMQLKCILTALHPHLITLALYSDILYTHRCTVIVFKDMYAATGQPAHLYCLTYYEWQTVGNGPVKSMSNIEKQRSRLLVWPTWTRV